MISRAQLIVAELIDASAALIARALQAVEVEGRPNLPDTVLELRERDGLLAIETYRYARSVELFGDAEETHSTGNSKTTSSIFCLAKSGACASCADIALER